MTQEIVAKSAVRRKLDATKSHILTATKIEVRAEITQHDVSHSAGSPNGKGSKGKGSSGKKRKSAKSDTTYVGQVYVRLNSGVQQKKDANGAVLQSTKHKQIYVSKIERTHYAELKSVLNTAMRNTREVLGEMNRVFDPGSSSGCVISGVGETIVEQLDPSELALHRTPECAEVRNVSAVASGDVHTVQASVQHDHKDGALLWSDMADVLADIRRSEDACAGASSTDASSSKAIVAASSHEDSEGEAIQRAECVTTTALLRECATDVVSDVGADIAVARADFPVDIDVDVTDVYLWKVGALSYAFADMITQVTTLHAMLRLYVGDCEDYEEISRLPAGALNSRLEVLATYTGDVSLIRFVAKFAADFERLISVRNDVVHPDAGGAQHDALDKALWMLTPCQTRLDDVTTRVMMLTEKASQASMTKTTRKQLRKRAAEMEMHMRRHTACE